MTTRPSGGKPAKDHTLAKYAADKFTRDVIVRGEAAVAGPDGKLPPGATHEIMPAGPAGKLSVVRRRFSAV